MIFADRKEAKRVMDGKVTAVLRPATVTVPFTTADQSVQWRRKATDEDPAIVRERQAKHPNEPAARETEGWVEIKRQSQTTLGAITEQQAKRLGHGSLRNLKTWVNANLDGSHANDEERKPSWRDDRPVWFVEFRRIQEREDQPTWLAHGRGVTHDPRRALDELETVDRGTQRRLTEGARRGFDLLRAEEQLKQRAKTLARRVREETITTARAGVDVEDELDQIEQQLERIRRKRDGLDEAA